MKKNKIYIPPNLDDWVGLIFFIYKRYYEKYIRLDLETFKDFKQEVYLINYQINEKEYKKGNKEDEKEVMKYINRRIYKFLKECGFKKNKKGWQNDGCNAST